MLVFIGYAIVLGAVFGGYALEGGHLGALFQPTELLMIGGAGIGSFLVGNNGKAIRATLRSLPPLLRGSKYTKALYMELMALLYVLLAKARKDGMLAIEADVDDPAASPIFSQYPLLARDARIMEFLTDYLRLMVSGNMNAFEIENLMDHEIETYKHEGEMPAHCISKVGDAMPAFGIVAAVMGVVHTMASADKPAAELGALIAQALVGTFLGVLLSYGFIGPLASLIEHRVAESSKVFQCIKVTLLASLNGYAPALAVEFGRKVLYSSERPSFAELEDHVRQVKAR
ncbi:flagellar motor stator protein MotA [Pandoraea sp.]|uniref:flagellar motor stator protein MotA n=1 Tax=Pandoraea sp. TaxID=1883445 RepID=UPI001214615B|nr:flagellar motor stator protein MotA [Pandoraea sp.]MBU6494432.1 flagellar motor stator protein MotA [Burkholderiales bacterium]MDE2288376.1 flagellar motor stator protein MotA [Burkholderiales bacterium]MDE2609463.1 flagellar motor stator protein MotA [Burkholderiales bacterium]TAL55991.1 MAG: flagellar motor stator protein MotA [Pandoraea sp.]TAM16736.1 MAG: flagellar motor stator protein MotA [Pandoraea sp.]